MDKKTKFHSEVVENGIKAVDKVRDLQSQGYRKDHIYVLAHNKEETEKLADMTGANEVGMSEEGVIGSMANLFRSRGDELRSKLESMGFDAMEANHLESQMDGGKVVIIAAE